VQHIGLKTECVLKGLAAGCDGAIFSMLILGMYITLTNGELPPTPYLTTVAFGFLVSSLYVGFRAFRRQRGVK
jgi:hypothetical protein